MRKIVTVRFHAVGGFFVVKADAHSQADVIGERGGGGEGEEWEKKGFHGTSANTASGGWF